MQPLEGRFSDADPADINREPSLHELLEDSRFRLLDDHQIGEVGAQRVDLVARAISMGYAVCIDVPGGSWQWQNYSAGVLSDTGAPTDHYVCLTGYEKDDSGFRIKGHNSWGTAWGIRDPEIYSGGAFEADESVLEAASDIIVCVERGYQ